MEPRDLFQLRRGLVEAGLKDEAAENVATALESAMAGKIDDVMAKWETKFDGQFTTLRTEFNGLRTEFNGLGHEMTVKFGGMLFAAVGLIIAVLKLWH